MLAPIYHAATQSDVAAIAERRKGYVREREYWQAEQKADGRQDRDAARWCSDQASEAMRHEKSATWAVSFINGAGPSYVPMSDGCWRFVGFPTELSGLILWELQP